MGANAQAEFWNAPRDEKTIQVDEDQSKPLLSDARVFSQSLAVDSENTAQRHEVPPIAEKPPSFPNPPNPVLGPGKSIKNGFAEIISEDTY